MAEHTPYQKKLIERYYVKRDEIMLGKLGEIVSELYLADSDKKRDRLWKRAEQAMTGLEVPRDVARHILRSRDPQVLARNLREWLSAKK